jgi:hypothetical protein
MLRLALMSAGLIFALIVVEVGLRIAGVEAHVLYVADEYRGWSLRPGVTTRGTQEGHAIVRTNSEGLRDREHTKSKPENTIRIAVLGDSFTEAQHVAAEDAFWAVMENGLAGCEAWGGQDVEVINFGVSDYGTGQELITLRRFAWDYSPDIVLLAFYRNDYSDNYKRTKARPYFQLEDGNLVLDNSFREDPDYKFRRSKKGRLSYYAVNHSRVLQIVNKNKALIGQLRSKVPFLATPVVLAAEEPQGPPIEKKTPRPLQTDPRNQDSLASQAKNPASLFTEELIATMNREVNERGAKFALIYVTTGPMFRPEIKMGWQTTTVEAVDEILKKVDMGQETAIANLGEREGFPALILAPEFMRYAAEHRTYLHGFEGEGLGGGHWNETGHRLAGDLTSEMLCQTDR